jgi:hypothetical protein
MWINTAAFLLEAPEYRGFGQGYFKHYIDFDRFVLSKNIDPHQILITARKLMLIENLVLFLVSFGLSIRLVGLLPSAAGFLLLALDPFHIALTRVSHMDGQLASLMMVSLLAFLVYLRQGQQKVPLIMSAITACLACLTKLPGYFLIPFFGMITMAAVIQKKKSARELPGVFNTCVKRLLKHALLFIAIIPLVYTALWPAMWVTPGKTIIDQVAEPFIFLVEDEDGNEDTQSVGSTPVNFDTVHFFRKLKYYPEGILWQTTPVVVFGWLAAVITWNWRKGFFSEISNRRSAYYFLLFATIYIAAVTLIDKRNPRYIIPAYSLLVLVAGYGLYSTALWLSEIKLNWVKRMAFISLSAAILIFQVLPVLVTYPYFYSYYNPLMGGSRKAGVTLFVGSGEGLDEAARYLNTKVDAQNLTAMSWYGSGCFSYYFSGTTIILPTRIGDKYIYENAGKADYLVIYNNQWLRQIPPELFKALATITPEKSIWINDIEYVRIYKIAALPLSYSQKIQ